jgi:alpha-tubulin suppressor-like RCC1 family protein
MERWLDQTHCKFIFNLTTALALTLLSSCSFLDNANLSGQEKKSNQTPSSPSSTLLSPDTFQSRLSGGKIFSCIRHPSGSIKCWGGNASGQLGDGSGVNQSLPVDVKDITNAIQVSGIGYHSCALLADGRVKCWGANGSGECGDGTTNDVLTPVDFVSMPNIIQVAAGASFTCVLQSSGQVHCLGFGNLSLSQVQGLPSDIISVSAGDNGADHNACALSLSGEVWCWSGASSPIAQKISYLDHVVQIAIGSGHHCALINDGSIKCWGVNYSGQLGDGTFNDSLDLAVAVSGIKNARQVSLFGDATCALLADGTIRCWGSNQTGQLGDGTNDNSNVPISPAGLDGESFIQVSQHHYHVCALQSSGKTYCWGNGTYGELGDGLSTSSNLPVQVQGI